ncbi:MAG: dephospho-CoA kinase [Candidatus Nanopelagicaceae bacterium]|nr:dephospho-CoA kinase [Candidatus Nanopelagicaceae bacterium]
MILIALTGGIGSGKSRAAAILEEFGAHSISADRLARETLERGENGYNEVVAYFGDEILSEGQIDRQKLANIVFNDEDALEKLESITHPLVRNKFISETRTLPENAVVVYEIPLLAESISRQKLLDYDHVIVLESNTDLRIARLVERGMSAKDAQLRIARQHSDEQRKKIATHLINNDGSFEELVSALSQWWDKFISPDITK